MILTHQKTKNPWDEVVFIGEGLGVGQTKRSVCPKCGGGESREQGCFAVSRSVPGRVHFICFRAKCSWKGTISAGTLVGGKIEVPYEKRLKKFSRSVEDLNAIQIQWFRDKFGISPDDDVVWCDSLGMYAYQIRGPDGQLRGWQCRDYRPGAIIKASNYVHRDEPFISWYHPDERNIGGVVVVEDIPSARKMASCGVTSVSLLGTSIDFERAYEIAERCENFVILALDRGTLPKCIEYRNQYEALWGSVEIWQLDKDLKAVTRKRINEALYDGKSDFISVPDIEGQL